MQCAERLDEREEQSAKCRAGQTSETRRLSGPLEMLVVEDDPDDFFLVDELLRAEMNARTQQALSVDEALRRIEERTFDAILLDYGLGAKTGLDLLSELQQRDVTTPVVFLTGHGDEALAVRALKAGAVDYLRKSGLNAESLATSVRHALALRDRDAAVRAAREALSARELEYRTLFETANDPILILDPASENIREANPAACRLYGCTHQELLTRSLLEFSTDIVRGRAAIDACLRTGQSSNFQTVHVARDGRRIHLLINGSTIDYRGERSLLVVARDISERIAAEQEIFRLNRALQALHKCSAALVRARRPEPFLAEICNIMVNTGGYRMAWVAAAPDEEHDAIRPLARAGVGQDYLELVCQRYLTTQPASLLVPSAIGTGEAAVCRDTRSDPRSEPMREECEQRGFSSIIALPLHVGERKFGALAIYAAERDAFDEAEVALLKELAATVSYGLQALESLRQKESAEEKLRESEVRYRTLFERNLAGVFRTDGNGTLTEANEAFVRMLRYQSAEELCGVRLRTLCAAAGDTEPYLEQLDMAGQMMNREMRMLRQDGVVAYLLASLVLLRDAQGHAEAVEGTVVDITERRQLESQLLQSQKMDAIGQLAGGIAHDFNNLLMVFRSYAEMIAEKVHGLPPDRDVGKEIDAILKAADRGATLTRQLLTFGRKQPFSPRVIDVNPVLENMGRVLPRALGEHIQVDLRPAPSPCLVKADPVQIEQLVLNLAVNARDAMPNGGRLTLETSLTLLDSDYVKLHAGVAPGAYVLLAVTDTGNGIAPDVLPRIFEPFFTTKERGKGTGLGLSTVYGIVQQSGGYVWVYSEPGDGTVFKIYLPQVASAASEPDASQNGAAPACGSETILLVEDEEAVRTAARRYLALRGYNVLEAACGEEALRLSDERGEATIDLLITDAIMPGMSGSVLAGHMLQRRPRIRIFYVSGYTEATIGERGGTPAAAFLQKPFSLSELARKVREVLDAARCEAPGTRQVA